MRAESLRLGDGSAAAVGDLGDLGSHSNCHSCDVMVSRLSALAPSGDPEVRKLVREVLQDMAASCSFGA